MKLTINFNLRNCKPVSKLQSVRAVIRIPIGGNKYEKLVYTTPFKVAPKYFDKDKQRISGVANEAYRRDDVNQYLDTLYNDAQIFFAQTMSNKEGFTLANLKTFLDERNNPKKTESKKYLIAYIDEFMKIAHKRKNERNEPITKATIIKYQTTFNHLKEFEQTTFKRKIEFKNIDLDFYDDLKEYFESKNQMPNTIGKHIAILKVFLNQATLDGLDVKQDFKHKTFKAIKGEVFKVYLNESELKRLYEFDLSNNKRLERIRDVFVMAAHTGGVRFSDYEQMTDKNIIQDAKGNHDLYIIQKKTKGELVIPLNKEALEILKKYNGVLPKRTSVNFNEIIKLACKEVGLTEKIMLTKKKGKETTSEIVEKWTLISSHTARRSFATNAVLKGMDFETVANITGHKNMTTFKNYVLTTGKEKADIFRANEQKAIEKRENDRKLKIA